MGLSTSSNNSSRISLISILPSTSDDIQQMSVAETSTVIITNETEKLTSWFVRWLLNPSFYSSSIHWKLPNSNDACTS